MSVADRCGERRMIAALVFGLCGILVPLGASLEAKELYVNGATGNDDTTYAANGPNAPWRTIGRAAWGSASRTSPNPAEAARAGDVVHVSAGHYTTVGGAGRFDVAFNPANSGSANAPITFRASGVVTLGYTGGDGPIIGASGRDYIVWDGFSINETQVQPQPDTGTVIVFNGTGNQLLRLTITGRPQEWRDNNNGIRLEQAKQTVIRNTRISGISGAGGQNSAALMMYDSNDTLVEHNEFRDGMVGIFEKGAHPGFTQARNIFRRNLVSRMSVRCITIIASDFSKYYQNILTECGLGGFTLQGLGGGPNNLDIVNNVVDGADANFVHGDGASGHTNVRIIGNIFLNGRIAVGSFRDHTPIQSTYQHNSYFGFRENFASFGPNNWSFGDWVSRTMQDRTAPASASSNPQFAGRGDYHLSKNSPARGGAIDVLDLNNNNSTTDLIDRGAYVLGNEVIGPTGGDSQGRGGDRH
jgi:hypothetical protein